MRLTANDKDVLQRVNHLTEGEFDGWTFGQEAEVEGNLVTIFARDTHGVHYSACIVMAEPPAEYSDIFTTEWDEIQVEVVED